MKNIFLVTVLHSSYDLLEEVSGNVLLQFSSASYVGKQIATTANFHYEDNVLLSLERLVESHYVNVTGASEHVEFLHYFSL